MLILQLIIHGLLIGSLYSLNALGLTFIYGVVGLINFAYSDFMMIAMFLAYAFYFFLGLDSLFSIPIIILICAFLGWLTYVLVIRRVLNSVMIAQALSTFGLAIFLRNMVVLIFTQDYRLIKEPIVQGQIYFGDLTISIPMLFAALVSVIASAALWMFLSRTKMGLALRATANNRQAALLMGINIDRMFALAFIIGSALVGVAGTVLSNFYYIYPYIGENFIIIIFATIALGGFGSLPGAFIAGLIIGLVESFAGFYLDPSLKYAVVFLVYVGVVIFRPTGLKGWNV